MGVIGLLVAGIVNIFLRSDLFGMVTSSIGVLIFVGLTAYDTQKIKELNVIGNEGTDDDKKEAIMGALTLYLDFINLFLYLLRLLGNRRN
jgi:FtsH-binding integral membrane protein